MMKTRQGWETKLILFAFFGIIQISACAQQELQTTPNTPFSPSTLSLTPTQRFLTFTPSPTKDPAPTSIPTSTSFPPYEVKQILAEYGVEGNHSIFEAYVTNDEVKWVLYSDAQLIINGPLGLTEKKLSGNEICSFFNNLALLGFYDIETNYKNDPTDPIYDFGDSYQGYFDDLYYYIFVNGESPKTLGTMDQSRGFLIPRMKSIMEYIDGYSPQSMSPYLPERLLLAVLDYEDFGTQPTEYRPLPENLLPAESGDNLIYLEGSKAADVYSKVFAPPNSLIVYTQGAKKYYVYYRVVFPHEVLGDPDRETQQAQYPRQPFPNPYRCGN